MKVTYTAFDGITFDSEKECIKHEYELKKLEYDKIFVDGPLKARSDYVMKRYLDYARKKVLSDKQLAMEDCSMRCDGAPFCEDFSEGIVYLRDDAVDILIDYIRILENEIRLLENELGEKE